MIRSNTERTGLIILVIVGVVLTVGIVLSSNYGRSITNIYYHLVRYVDDPRPETYESKVEPILFALDTPWWIVSASTILEGVAAAAIVIYAVRRRRTPRGWCLFAGMIGVASVSLLLFSPAIRREIYALFGTDPWFNGPRESLLIATYGLEWLAILGATLGGLALLLMTWSLARRGNKR